MKYCTHVNRTFGIKATKMLTKYRRTEAFRELVKTAQFIALTVSLEPDSQGFSVGLSFNHTINKLTAFLREGARLS